MSDRLDQLRALRDRIDAEILAEQAKQRRIATLAARVPVPSNEPVDEIEPSRADAAVIRRWMRAQGHTPPPSGSLSYEIRRMYARAGEPYGAGRSRHARAYEAAQMKEPA